MARNTGSGYRKGAVTNRDQVYNPKTDLWIKRDASTGKFMQAKTTGGTFKGVAKSVDGRRAHAK